MCPAATMPGSLTTSARRAPSSPANSPSASTLSGPKTIRVRGWKSKGIMRSAEVGGLQMARSVSDIDARMHAPLAGPILTLQLTLASRSCGNW